jgi:hypothetical protein
VGLAAAPKLAASARIPVQIDFMGAFQAKRGGAPIGQTSSLVRPHSPL